MFDRLNVVQAHRTGVLDFDTVDRSRTRCSTTDVEGTHGQLSTRLTDGLRRDNADRLTDVDLVTARQVTSITLATDAVTGFACDWRAYAHLVDTGLFQRIDQPLIEKGTRFTHNLVGTRAQYIDRGNAAEDTLAQRFDDVATLDDRLHQQTVVGTTVGHSDDHVLRNIDQASGQVTRVGGLECGVGQAFTCTVGRDEVLEDVQTFAEVCGNWRLDDRAIRLGHQATHAGELTNLGRRTTRTGVCHHVDRVERVLLHLVAFAVGDALLAELPHHRASHLVVGVRPDVDDLVVALAVRNETRRVLVLDLFDLGLGRGQDIDLLRGNDHVVNADRNAGAGRLTEAQVHQLVSKHHGVFQTKATVAGVDQARDGFLGHRLVDQIERHTGRHDVPQQCTPNRGFLDGSGRLHLVVLAEDAFFDAHLDLGM